MRILTIPMSVQQWVTAFLEKRGLEQPDKRSLFAYKTTSDEFESLKQLLRNTQHQPNNRHYSQAWLLFAAEWWKREYAGGAWNWTQLHNTIELKDDTPYKLTHDLVEKGHRQWQLETEFQKTGKRYFAMIVVNGGLPMQLLKSAQGKLHALLYHVIEQSLRYSLKTDQLRLAVEQQAIERLPVSYQQPAMYELLEQLITTVLELRTDYQLAAETDPLKKLEQACPDWKQHFPLDMDEQVTDQLIQGLVTEAAGIKPASKQSAPFQLRRNLRFSTDDSPPVPELLFSMAPQISRENLLEALDWKLEADQLPPQLQLWLQIGQHEELVGEALLKGDSYRLIAKKTLVPITEWGVWAASAQLIISRWGAGLHRTAIPGGEALNPDEPWIFEDNYHNNYPVARLLAQGDTLIKGQSALLLAPAKAIVCSDEGDACKKESSLSGKALWRLPSGITRCTYRKQSFQIEISPTVSPIEAYWHGQSLDAQSTPSLLFVGLPCLRQINELGEIHNVPRHELYVQTASGELIEFQKAEVSLKSRAIGLCRLIWRKNNQRLQSSQAILLPKTAVIAYKPDTANTGQICLENWPDIPVCCLTKQVSLSSRHDGRQLILELTCTATEPVASVSLGFQWPKGEQRLELAFPSQGVTLLDPARQRLQSEHLMLEELHGCRALLRSVQSTTNWQVRLSTGKLVQSISYSGIAEIRLFELIPAIRQMLSCLPELDQRVELELIHSHHPHKRLTIGRYSSQIRLHSQNQMASISDGRSDRIPEPSEARRLLLALALAEPERKPEVLPLVCSEQGFTGNWQLSLPTSVQGPWVLYVADHPTWHSRPTIVPAYEPPSAKGSLGQKLAEALSAPKVHTPLSPLCQALCIADSEQRLHQLRRALQAMTNNPDPDDADWQSLTSLIIPLQHLPLACLDIYRALIQEPLALVLATLLLDNFAQIMAERLPQELPFEWLLISPQHWWQALELLSQQVNNPREQRALCHDIQRKSQYLSLGQPALSFIFDQGLFDYFQLDNKDVRLFRNTPSSLIKPKLSELFGGDKPAMQHLFWRNSEQTYPEISHRERDKFLNTPDGKRLLKLSNLPATNYKLGIVILPFIVAFDAYAGNGQHWQSDSARLFSLRQTRQFDPTWFDAAYELGLMMAQANSTRN